MNEVSLKPVIDELETLFSKFNKAFFEGKLEKPVITVSPDQMCIRDSGNSVPEGKKATLKADSDKLIRFSHAPGGFLHTDLVDGRFRNRGGSITHQVIKGNAGCIGKGLDTVRAGGVLPGKVLADSGLGSPGLFRQGDVYKRQVFVWASIKDFNPAVGNSHCFTPFTIVLKASKPSG